MLHCHKSLQKSSSGVSCLFMQSMSLPAHLHAPVHASFPFLHVQLCDLHPFVHPHETISVHDSGIEASDTSFGNSCLSSSVQPKFTVIQTKIFIKQLHQDSNSSCLLFVQEVVYLMVEANETVHGAISALYMGNAKWSS